MYNHGNINLFVWTSGRIGELIQSCFSWERGVIPGGSNGFLREGRNAILLVRLHLQVFAHSVMAALEVVFDKKCLLSSVGRACAS